MGTIEQLSSSLKDRYVVDREIGRGGMATVYLARDPRHNRNVALKVLNPELGAVLGVERFLSEIQVTANLQHPNLLPLFDSGEANGLLFYVMPYVEGESLRKLLMREKQLPIDDALRIATAVASALDYAHRHGVIHRDLKPENILLQEGQPVVADFGIALAVSNAGGNRITQTGLSLGTPQYMSPEQATGDREIDGRTDVYSLGAMTYEMLVGEPPHDGKTSQAIIAKVLTDKPRSIRLTRESVPRQVEAAVEKALAKLPADRFHTAKEFADSLAGKVMTGHFVSGATPTALRGPRTWQDRARAAMPWAVAVAALAAAGAGWGVAIRSATVLTPERYEIPLPASTTLPVLRGHPLAISPDGRFIAFVGRSQSGTQRLYLRAANELQAREVAGSEDATFPFFSPEGAWLGFTASGQVKKVPVAGGAAVPLMDYPPAQVSWSHSGWLVTVGARGLSKAPATGGAPVEFTVPDTVHGETRQLAPVVLPDGKTILYSSFAAGGAIASRIGVASLESGESRVLDVQGSSALGVLDGHLIYTTAVGNVMAIRFEVGSWRVSGTPIQLADQAVVDAANTSTYASLSPEGSLVYMAAATRTQMVFVSTDGSIKTVGEPGIYRWPRLSPDGRRIAVTVGSLASRDVYIYELPSGPLTQLTNEGQINDRPEWTPDSRTVLFRSTRRGANAIWAQQIDSREARKVFGLADSKIDEGVLSSDGKFLIFQRDQTGNGEAWYRAMSGDTTPREVEVNPSGYAGRFSPDGKWVVYASGGSGSDVFVRSFPSMAIRHQVSANGGTTPVWSADGKRIYYVVSGQLVAATVGSTQPFTIAGRATVLAGGYSFDAVHADFDVARDGRTILALRTPNEAARLVVVRNLGAEIKARLAGTPR